MSTTVKKAMSTDVAVQELTTFLKKHLAKDFRRGKLTEKIIKDEYLLSIEAIEDGNLVFDENGNPKYTLYSPLFASAEDKSLVVKEVEFRQRIKGADRILLMDGIDPKKDLGTYAIKTVSYICKLSITEVKELDKDDFDTLNQICSVF